MSEFIEMIRNGMLAVFKFEEIVTVLISILPIVEARGAIPIGIGYGIHPALSWLYSFLGSSAIVPLLLLLLIPFINLLRKTKLFKRIGDVIYEKFEKKSASVDGGNAETEETEESKKKSERKKFWGVLLFVAVPAPLTGVWTGSAIAAITKLPFHKAVAAVIGGNLIASGIITLLCVLFKNYVDLITLIIGVIAILVVVALIVKIILHKPKTDEKKEETSDRQK